MGDLSKDFSEREFWQPARHGFLTERPPPSDVMGRIILLAREVLQPIRDELGVPVRVLSGWRGKRYNYAVGGVKASRHLTGEAADIVAEGIPPLAVHDLILNMHRFGKLPRLGGLGSYPGFTHVDIRHDGSRRVAHWFSVSKRRLEG